MEWKLLKSLAQSAPKSISQLPPRFAELLAARLCDVVDSASSEELGELEHNIGIIFESLLSEESSHSVANSAPFRFGQIGFAQKLIATLMARRASSEASAVLSDPKYVAYLRSLVDSEKTNSDLQKQVQETSETVSRKLKVLRELGITDFRREGTSVINFLSPSLLPKVQAIFGAHLGDTRDEIPAESVAEATAILSHICASISPHLREPLNFAHTREGELS